MWDLGARGGSAKAPALNNAPGGSTARATRAWRKHALLSSETLSIIQSRRDAPQVAFWKHRAPKMRLVEAQCAHRKHCKPETPLGSHPTCRVSQVSPDSWVIHHCCDPYRATQRGGQLSQPLPASSEISRGCRAESPPKTHLVQNDAKNQGHKFKKSTLQLTHGILRDVVGRV